MGGDPKRKQKPAIRYRLFRMVSVGVVDEPINQFYDIVSTAALVINLIASILLTFDAVRESIGPILDAVEYGTVLFFALDYFLRLITADFLYPEKGKKKAVLSYIVSGSGLIDLMSFLPYLLPVFFPSGAAVFRLFRVVRILRLFRINAYYDSLNVITDVLYNKRQQLVSSFFIILILMLASSLCMYSLEHAAQPDVFKNAFSGIWWSVSTLLTVGYGDIYPVTPLGKVFGTIISFLGVGMVAIPTGIISAGFVEQYSHLKQLGEAASGSTLSCIRFVLTGSDEWNGKEIRELTLPGNMHIAAVEHDGKTAIPHERTRLKAGDLVTIAAAAPPDSPDIRIEEVKLTDTHPWNGVLVRDLDISKQSFLFLVKRQSQIFVPDGSVKLAANDTVYLYRKQS